MRVVALVLLLCSCFEVIEHTPEGACVHDSDCACGFDCNVLDAGIARCGTRLTHSCNTDPDCHPAGLPHCVDVARDGGSCGYKICQ